VGGQPFVSGLPVGRHPVEPRRRLPGRARTPSTPQVATIPASISGRAPRRRRHDAAGLRRWCPRGQCLSLPCGARHVFVGQVGQRAGVWRCRSPRRAARAVTGRGADGVFLGLGAQHLRRRGELSVVHRRSASWPCAAPGGAFRCRPARHRSGPQPGDKSQFELWLAADRIGRTQTLLHGAEMVGGTGIEPVTSSVSGNSHGTPASYERSPDLA
jgi:hypothetical protein